MSRYTFDVDGTEWAVGYDTAAASYFADAFPAEDPDSIRELVDGGTLGAVPTFGELKALLDAEGVTLPPTIERDLAADEPAAPGGAVHQATANQAALLASIGVAPASSRGPSHSTAMPERFAPTAQVTHEHLER